MSDQTSAPTIVPPSGSGSKAVLSAVQLARSAEELGAAVSGAHESQFYGAGGVLPSGEVILLPPPGLQVNVPTDEGRSVGQILAELVACPTHEMCGDCVFRHGSFPNGCEATLDDAMQCIIDPKKHGAFFCVHRDDGTLPICKGYAHAVRSLGGGGAEHKRHDSEPAAVGGQGSLEWEARRNGPVSDGGHGL